MIETGEVNMRAQGQRRATATRSVSKPHKETQSKAPVKQKAFALDDFEFLRMLGRGSFGEVKLVRHRQTQELYALKMIRKEKIRGAKHIQHVKNEKSTLQDLSRRFGGAQASLPA